MEPSSLFKQKNASSFFKENYLCAAGKKIGSQRWLCLNTRHFLDVGVFTGPKGYLFKICVKIPRPIKQAEISMYLCILEVCI